jgi:cation diffusion facilitator CzcD-associated flavoprotein CzcO
VPTERYARALEILAHSRAIGRKHDLYRGACFQTEVTGLRWDEDGARWTLSTNRGDTMEFADFQKMEQIRARVDAIVEDPVTAEALKPRTSSSPSGREGAQPGW